MTTPPPISAPQKQPLTIPLFLILAGFAGSWLIFDGLHQRITGDYVRVGGQLGPWAGLASAVGLNPAELAWPFIVLGNALIVSGVMLTQRRRWAYQVALLGSGLLLLYLGPGTLLALVALTLLLLKPTRAYFP